MFFIENREDENRSESLQNHPNNIFRAVGNLDIKKKCVCIYIYIYIYIWSAPPIRPRSVCLHYDLNAHIACIDPVRIHIYTQLFQFDYQGGRSFRILEIIGKTLGKLENSPNFQLFLRFFQFFPIISNIFQFSLVFSNFPII